MSAEPRDPAGAAPPRFRRWGLVYAAVLAHLALWIAALWLLSRRLGGPG